MATRPEISVIIPTYNRRRWIGDCLESLTAQTYRDFEAIVIDDGSSDGTVEWLRGEPRFAFAQVHVQARNGGASEARNEGVRRARGRLVTFIDSDDLLEPEHLETAARAFRELPHLGLFCCDARMIGPDGELLLGGRTWHAVNGAIKRYPVQTGLRPLAEVFTFSNCFPGFTLCREVYQQVGGLDQSLFPLDDYDLALRVAGAGFGVYYCHRPLARYRSHGDNSSGAGNGLRVAREKLRCLRLAVQRHPELRLQKSLVSRRLAEVEVELAIAHARGNKVAAAATLLKAFARDRGQMVQVGRLVWRKLRRPARQ